MEQVIVALMLPGLVGAALLWSVMAIGTLFGGFVDDEIGE